MASSRDDNPYGEGLGTGGKFRKRPVRRSQTTPYARPPTAIRNPIHLGNNNGWIRKIVDPAHRILTAGANRLFSSVFRKRLPPPPSPPPPEVNVEAMDKYQEVDVDFDVGQERPLQGVGNSSHNCNKGGLGELEQILKKKTFTRSEIERLTTLLHSKTVDSPNEEEEKRFSRPILSHDRKEVLPYNPVQENGPKNELCSTPSVSKSVGKLADTFRSNVLDEDVASPAEIAKAYMGSRASNISPSKHGFRGQSFREVSTAPSSVPFPYREPAVSLVPRNSGYCGAPENGFVNPRIRGRSAIYNMARAPNFGVYPSSTLKIAGSTTDGYGGSSSQIDWEKNVPSGSKHADLKRRSSVLESDIGPIRRIRQKANYVSPRNKMLSLSDRAFSSFGNGNGSAVQHPTSSTQTPILLDESTPKLKNRLEENGDNCIPGTSSTPVPSKSNEMASKILQQLDKLVPKDKSPTKLSPSMLHGQALRSLENVEASVFVEKKQYNNDSSAVENLLGSFQSDSRKPSSQMQDKVDVPSKLGIPSGKLALIENGEDTKTVEVTHDKTFNSAASSSAGRCPPKTKRAFQMSAHEDFVDLDDDVYSNGAATTPLVEERQKLDSSAAQFKTAATEACSVTVEKLSFPIEAKSPFSSTYNKITPFGTSDDSITEEKKSSSFTASPFSTAVLPTAEATQSMSKSDKTLSPKESNAAPPISFADKAESAKESNATFPTYSFAPKIVDNVPQFTSASSSSSVIESSGPKFCSSSDPKPEGSISFGSMATGATDTAAKVPELEKAGGQAKVTFGGISPNIENSFSTSTSSSNSSIFSFGVSSNFKSSNNGSAASSLPILSPAVSPLFSSSAPTHNSSTFSISTVSTAAPISSVFGTDTTTSMTSDTTISSPASSAVLASSPIFKFGSSIAPSTESTQVSAASGSTENRVTTPFAIGTSSAVASTSSIFGVSIAPASSTPNNQFQVSNPFGAGSGSLPSAEATPAGTGPATFTQSMPSQFGSAASVPLFGLGNTTSSSGSSIFGSSTPASGIFGSGITFGVGASTTSSGPSHVSSSNAATSSLFGSSLQQTKTPAFGSTFNSSSSTVFSFGQSSASPATANAAPIVFGSSSAASSSSPFPFTSAVATTSSQPVFGAPTAYTFGSSPSGNNDQMNMEDSMAEDSVQASTPPVPAFGQQQTVFTPPSAFTFGSTAPSGASTFQFAGQQTQAIPPNQSLFQASGSLEAGAGGSFSLGTTGDKSGRKFVKVRKSRKK